MNLPPTHPSYGKVGKTDSGLLISVVATMLMYSGGDYTSHSYSLARVLISVYKMCLKIFEAIALLSA